MRLASFGGSQGHAAGGARRHPDPKADVPVYFRHERDGSELAIASAQRMVRLGPMHLRALHCLFFIYFPGGSSAAHMQGSRQETRRGGP
jgi:hypothetical protein